MTRGKGGKWKQAKSPPPNCSSRTPNAKGGIKKDENGSSRPDRKEADASRGQDDSDYDIDTVEFVKSILDSIKSCPTTNKVVKWSHVKRLAETAKVASPTSCSDNQNSDVNTKGCKVEISITNGVANVNENVLADATNTWGSKDGSGETQRVSGNLKVVEQQRPKEDNNLSSQTPNQLSPSSSILATRNPFHVPVTSARDEGVNVVLIGEAGVGKSTLINAIINYFCAETFENAQKSRRLVMPASSRFTVVDKNYEVHEVNIGPSAESEEREGGETEDICTVYCLTVGSRLLRLVDIPGIGGGGDERKDEDTEPKAVLKFLQDYSLIHAVLIVMKPNSSRVTTPLRGCIEGLVRQFHRSIAANINFVFTHAASTHFSHGDTTSSLKGVLDEIKRDRGVAIPFNDDNVFFFDNLGFRNIAIRYQEIEIEDEDLEDAKDSWRRGVEECARLFARIIKLEPHSVGVSMRAEENRQRADRLAIAVCQAVEFLATKIDEVEQETELLEKQVEPRQKRTPLSRPYIMCRSGKCSRSQERRSCYTPQTEKLKWKSLSIFSNQYGYSSCRVCKCLKTQHESVEYETVTHPTPEEAMSLRRKINDHKGEWNRISSELSWVLSCSAAAMWDLGHSTTEDCVEMQLKFLPSQFRQRHGEMSGYKGNLLRKLEGMPRMYREEKRKKHKWPLADCMAAFASLSICSEIFKDVVGVERERQKSRQELVKIPDVCRGLRLWKIVA